ncbi:hypothetical protein DRP07_00525 [Archaeoglobales archaeon]|nr:MAG: hypothetical protein DRP07_00525 [Archaeoglobales archaeon]
MEFDSRRNLPRDKKVGYQCWFCKAEGRSVVFDTVQALAGHIRMAHKSSTRRRKRAKQIEKAVNKIAGIFSEDQVIRIILRHRGEPIAEFRMTPSIKKIVEEALEISKKFDNRALPVAIVLSNLGLSELRWYV